MRNLLLSLLELQRGNRTLTELKAEIEHAVSTTVVDARELLEQLENAPLDEGVRRELSHCILGAETTRLTLLRDDRPSTEGEASSDTSGESESESDSGDETITSKLTTLRGDPPSAAGDRDPDTEQTRLRSEPSSGDHPRSSETTLLRTLTATETAQEASHSASPGRPGIGTVLNGRFELVESIGRGGMSEVFKALDRRRADSRSRSPYVALKVMTVGGEHFSIARVAMQREAERCQRLNHPGIVRVHDFDYNDTVVYMSMELLSGRPLNAILKEDGPEGLPDHQAAAYATQIAEALSYAHGQGIVHADLKPGNVFVTDEDELKVIDFGIARALPKSGVGDPSTTMFDARKQLGALTPAYASSELMAGEPPNPRDDLYALGCIVFEMYTGKHPFGNKDAIVAQAQGLVLRRPEQIPARRWRAIEHALAFGGAARTSDAATFLREFASGSATRATAYAFGGAAVAAVAVVAMLVLWPTGEPSTPATSLVADCAECPPLMAVAPGSFRMGLPESEREAKGSLGFHEFPVTPVSIPAAYFIGLHEVTVGEFRAFAAGVDTDFSGCRTVESEWAPDAARSWSAPGFSQTDSHPVACVSWNDAQGYVEWLSERTGERYRLPSESEWEFVARRFAPGTGAGDQGSCTDVNVADETTRSSYPGIDAAACSDGYAHTAPVERLGAGNVSDLLGNVFEWTQDCWAASLDGIPPDGSARSTADCPERVLRGGSWFTAPSQIRVTFRNRFPPDYRSNTFGFRVARDLGELK